MYNMSVLCNTFLSEVYLKNVTACQCDQCYTNICLFVCLLDGGTLSVYPPGIINFVKEGNDLVSTLELRNNDPTINISYKVCVQES